MQGPRRQNPGFNGRRFRDSHCRCMILGLIWLLGAGLAAAEDPCHLAPVEIRLTERTAFSPAHFGNFSTATRVKVVSRFARNPSTSVISRHDDGFLARAEISFSTYHNIAKDKFALARYHSYLTPETTPYTPAAPSYPPSP
jgi:hypothetical protein